MIAVDRYDPAMQQQLEPGGWFLKYPADVVCNGGFDARKYPFPYVCIQASDKSQEEMLQVQDVVVAATELWPHGWRLVNVLMTDGIALAILIRA
jgi:hypothetical protein